MSDLQDYIDLKEKVEKLRRESDKAAGALEQAEEQLNKRFNVSTLEEAEKLLDKMKKEEAKIKNQFLEALEGFEEKWEKD